ncbi:MAG: 23S rRNA (guanosine(2251)-2'-O)-methyltransferase RlmB [Gracilibacteraceae bacterium]|nr:23S rRNA (guanosine(2251)-2'-O)-methyltransferase RlmB [Gracilibacteraceae bacterium]
MASNYSKPSRQVSKLKKSKPYDKAKPIGKRKPFEKAAPYEAGKLKDKYKTGLWQEEADNDDINLIEGRNPVLEALKSGREIDKIFIQKGAGEGSIRQIIAIAREKKILVKEVDKAKLDGLSKTRNHQGVIASAALYKYYEVEDILSAAKEKGEDPFIIILDEITDNNNLGSILRSADASGVHGIIIPKRRAVGLTPAVAKISAGAVEYVPVAKVTNLNHTIEYLKKEGLWIVGADMGGETYYGKDMTGPIALVIGSEGEGLGRLIKENCDFLVSIPMRGKISSLNAAVSAAIILFEIQKQRAAKKIM